MMFYQEKHPGEKQVHLFQTNKHNLQIINLLFRRQMVSLVAPLTSAEGLSVSMAQWEPACCSYRKTPAGPAPVAGWKHTWWQGTEK